MTRALILEGEFEEPWSLLPRMSAGWLVRMVEHERDADLGSREPGYHRDRVAEGWETLLRATRYIAEQIERGVGARMQIGTRALGSKIGMSQSTGARCLRRLHGMNLLSRYREHRIRKLRTRFGENLMIGKAAIYEVVTHYRGLDPVGDESRPLTRGSGAGGTRADMGRSPMSGPPTTAA